MKKLRYFVNAGGKWFSDGKGGGRNFLIFDCPKAANRYFSAKPGRRLDVRGINRHGRYVKYCWKYWERGRIIEQTADCAGQVRFVFEGPKLISAEVVE